jgi:phosphoglycerol transferase MdoB-like AlkP superfamily enzyme
LSDKDVPGLIDDGCKSISKKSLSIAEEQEDDLFMFINMMEAHLPHRLFRGMDRAQFDLPSSWNSNTFDYWAYNESERHELERYDEDLTRFREFYAAAIDYLDRQVSTLIEGLEKTLDDEVVTIITADHGENLGGEHDRYLMEHTGSLTEGLLHVPFEIVNSPIELSGTDSFFSLCELPNLVTAIINEEDYTLGTTNVSAEVFGEGLHLDSKESEYWNRAIRCTYDAGTKFEWDTLGNRYRVAVSNDGSSTEKILEEDVEINDELKHQFKIELQSYKGNLSQSTTQGREISDTTESRLRELGYI